MDDVKKILNRYKELHNLRTDLELADYLGLKQNTIASWKMRETLDLNLLIDKAAPYVDFNQLIRGVKIGDMPSEHYLTAHNLVGSPILSAIPLVTGRIPFSRTDFVEIPPNSFVYVNKSFIQQNMEAAPESVIAFQLIVSGRRPHIYKINSIVFVDTQQTRVSNSHFHDFLCMGEPGIPAVTSLIEIGINKAAEPAENGADVVYTIGRGFDIIGRVVGLLEVQKPINRNNFTGFLDWPPSK